MIIDRIDNYKRYEGLGLKISLVLDHIRKTDFISKETGRYDIDGDEIFVVVSNYHTRDRAVCRLEAHRKYIDVQYMAEGSELIGYAHLTGQKIALEYDAENDIEFFEGDASFIKLDQGMFAIFHPQDLHMPGTGEGNPVRKIVVKVKV